MEQIGKVTSQAVSHGSETRLTDSQKAQYLRAAKLLLGCYRTGDANDPEVYIAATVRVLSAYPMDVVARVIDPLTGLPSRVKWLPTVPELVSACEEIEGFNRRMRESKARSIQQLAERDANERADQDRIPPETWKAEFAKGGLVFGKREADEQARLKECAERARKATHEDISRAWAARGEPAPMLPDGSLISPSLIDRVRAWQTDPETVAAEQRWKEDQRLRA